MLQPRFSVSGMEFRWSAVCFVLVISMSLLSCQEINDDVNEPIEATRIKREGVPENRDLTVLLVNDQQRNDYNTKVGRYHSVKPLIGLLTSTARTFIQDGVTTEFATQILGTTLDNGRIYAQLLTKSSLVLYNKPTNIEDPVIVKPTRKNPDFDGQWNVKQDLGFIDPEKFALKNTDYLAPSKMDIVYASKAAHDIKYWNSPTAPDSHSSNHIEEPVGRRVQPVSEIPRYVQHEAFNYLDGPAIDNEKKVEFVINPSILENVNTLHRQSKAFEPVTEPIKLDSLVKEDSINESSVIKVKPNFDLPTFTIKNEFSPIFYYIDNVESRRPDGLSSSQTKLPKKLFGQKSESRPKKTFTYAGFADFTTVVGDTVIIFSPNTASSPQNPQEVNVFPSAKRVDKLATKITFLSADIPVATSTFKAHDLNAATKLTTPSSSSDIRDENRSEKALYNDEESLKKVLYEIDDKVPDAISVQYNNGFDFNVDVIQSSESAVTTTDSIRTTDDLGVIPIHQSSHATEPLGSIYPSSTTNDDAPETSLAMDDMADILSNSEEESENTAAEMTEASEEENEDTTTESEIITTTESGHSEESSEELETTTEGKFETHDDVVCTNGIETQSTMTTEFKTLTYLTTYFIPLESTETTTSVKSDVVVESKFGYITNVICKNDFDILPTPVVSISKSESTKESTLPVNTEVTTEADSVTTQVEKEIVTASKNDEVTSTNSEDEPREDRKDISTVTTTEQITTNRIEVSVSTENSTTPTENPITEENTKEDDTSENEIDLIYKTLYTTYTYFTTFFGDHTSSVTSHKSIVTNIITSTIDLSQLDPSLLGAFNEDEIAPTSVGIGRPTESYASIVDLVKNKDVIESVEIGEKYSSQTPTPSLGDDIASINPDAVKTYYTTYTFFTTIYVGSDANVCSRSEVYTNYVGPDSLIPTKTNPLAVSSSRAQFDFRNCKQTKRDPPANAEETSSMEKSVSMEENSQSHEDLTSDVTPKPSPLEVEMLFSVESNPLEIDNSFVTDVKSSSSKGERKYLDNNNVLEDQISSESNIDEIMPSPTLLLQTSYTTFTYFTTMYIGKDSSKIKSRLETVTNVVTETITPKKEVEEESNLPITYYTTFIYWTTLYKDKSTTITTREEIVSNVVTPIGQSVATISPIDTTPIDVESVVPSKESNVEIKPSIVDEILEQDDGKATFYTTYTYFTTFYAGNSSQIRSSLETVTNIVDNTKVLEDNQLGRKVASGSGDKNLIQDNDGKPHINPTNVKEEITPTQLADLGLPSTTVLSGTYIDNLFAEVKPVQNDTKKESEPKILFSQVAVISGDSTIVTSDNKTLNQTESTTSGSTTTVSESTDATIVSPTPQVIESSVGEPETTTEYKPDSEEEEEDDKNSRKKGRPSYTPKKPAFTPVIIPFASIKNRPTFSLKRPLLISATTITRLDVTPTITATPLLKTVRPNGFGSSRKQSSFSPSASGGRKFFGRSSLANPSANIPSASRSGGFGRNSIQPTSRRTGFRSSSTRSNSQDFASRSAFPRIRPSALSRLRGSKQSASVSLPPPDQNESETTATQQEENATEALEEVTEAPARATYNPLFRFKRPPIARQPGTAITPRTSTLASRRTTTPRGRITTTTKRSTTRSTVNPLFALRRQRPNSLFPKRNLFKQPEPEPEEEIKENEQKVEESEEILEGEEEFGDEDNDYDSSDRKEQQVSTPSTPAPKKSNTVQIKPFNFKRRTKRQVDYGNRKYSNFRRPGSKVSVTRQPDPEPETEAPVTQKPKSGRFNSRVSSNSRPTTSSPKSSSRQPFIIRGESRGTTTSSPAYRRPKARPSLSTRSSTVASKPSAPRLSANRNIQSRPSTSRVSNSRSRTRTTTSRASSRQRGSFENHSGEKKNYNSIVNDGKITITHHIPTEVTIPVVNGKITEYKNILTAKPSIETLLQNQVSTTIGPHGNQQLVLAYESTEIADNGATKLIKFVLQETPTTTHIYTPTTIRGRKTSWAHILPSTVYNVEPVTQTIAPEINANVPLANLLLSQLLLGNQQPAINPLLALQGQGLLPQQPVVQTPVTEYKTRTTTYVTTVTDSRETVLSITFKGRPIQTTISDPTINVITATEYVTDTVVSTPTFAPQPQFNSLLLPLLLQQQQQQQQQQALSLQTANPLLGLGQLGQPDLLQNNLNNDIYSNSPKPNILSDLNSNEDFSDDNSDAEEESLPPPPPPPSRSKTRSRAPKPSPPKLTNVVTLYVSGRHPGEFSTVLSTVVTENTQNVRKREAIYYEDVQVSNSILPVVDELVGTEIDDELSNSLIAETERYINNPVDKHETQSLESIVGEVSKHIRYGSSPTYVVELGTPTAIRNIKQSSIDHVS